MRTIPNLSTTFGHFLTSPKRMPLLKPRSKRSRFVWVINTEEKGSDVNLASHLLLDAFRKDCEVAFVSQRYGRPRDRVEGRLERWLTKDLARSPSYSPSKSRTASIGTATE